MYSSEKDYIDGIEERTTSSKYTKTVRKLALEFGEYVGYDPRKMNIHSYTRFLKEHSFVKYSDAASACALIRGLATVEFDADWGALFKKSCLDILDVVDLEEEAKLYVSPKEWAAFEEEMLELIEGGYRNKSVVTEVIVYIFYWNGITRKDVDLKNIRISGEDTVILDGKIIKDKLLVTCLTSENDLAIDNHGKTPNRRYKSLLRGLSDTTKKVLLTKLNAVYISGILASGTIPTTTNYALIQYYIRIQEILLR